MAETEDIRNARIDSTFLGTEDHGVFIAQLNMDYGDGGRQALQRIIATRASADYAIIREILDAVAVASWEDLRGQYCRVRLRSGLIRQIGHITRDEWTSDPDARERR